VKLRIALLVAAVAVAAPAYVMVNSTQAGASVRFTFTQHLTNVEAVINGQRTLTPMTVPSPGDSFLFRSDLIQNGVVVGFSNDVCTETFNLDAMCNTVFAFAN
jgi:hypothetical protein